MAATREVVGGTTVGVAAGKVRAYVADAIEEERLEPVMGTDMYDESGRTEPSEVTATAEATKEEKREKQRKKEQRKR